MHAEVFVTLAPGVCSTPELIMVLSAPPHCISADLFWQAMQPWPVPVSQLGAICRCGSLGDVNGHGVSPPEKKIKRCNHISMYPVITFHSCGSWFAEKVFFVVVVSLLGYNVFRDGVLRLRVMPVFSLGLHCCMCFISPWRH